MLMFYTGKKLQYIIKMQLSNQLVSILTAALFIHLVLLRTGQASLQFLGQPQFTAYVSRAAPPGSVVYTLTAINSTTHARPDGIRYTLVEGSYDSSLFELHALTGQLVNLQYLPLQSWSLQVQAHTGADSLQAELLVIVEPEYKFLPVFERSIFSFSISEETPVGSLFGVVRAFSLDPEVEGHSYTIITGNAGNDLAISTTTGVLTVARELDYEVTSEYSLIVEYSDGAGHITVSVEVEVLDENDNSPIFPVVLYEATLSESAHVGSTVLTVFASDDDAGENSEMTYSILEGDVNRFEIESLSGELTTAVLFDYEQEVEYTFIVIASDGGDPMLTTSVIVVVSIENEDDECPIFLSTYYTITFPPESVPEVEEVVTTVHAIDPDYIGSITYSIEPSSPAFSIDPITGAVTLHDTTPNKHTLRLLAIDDGACEHETFVTVVINVGSTNRHTPQFMTPCSGQILEGSPTGTIATTLEATDDDAGIYGEVTYAFSEENSVFSIHSSTGDVTLLDEEGLDYEEKKSYFIDVTATDLSNRQAYCLLTITVLDANDHAPQFIGTEDFDYEVRLPEFAPIGSFVVQMLAEDADNGSNAVVEYELLEETGDFSIDDTSGVVTVAIASLSAGVYTLSIQASNPNEMSPLMSSVRSLTVHVSSDSVIAFNQSLYTTTICENLQVSTPALEVFTNETELVFFSIVSGSEYSSNSEDVFEILDDTSGVITASSQANIDYEQLPNSKFVFSVTAEHLTGATHSISTVEITLLDSDDNSPTFQSGHIYTVSENAPIGTTVGHISATDPDSGTNGDIAFSFIQGNDMFTITDSGDLVTNMEIDAEAMALDTIVRINARNPNPVDPDSCTSGPRPSATVVITITTLNLNDNSPFFVDPAISSVSLPEDTPVHSTITTFSASDNDVDSSPSDIQYSITGDDMQQNFILSENGALVLVKPLDYEVRQSFVLNVEVSDGLNTNSTQYTVNVANIDDEAPIFTRDFYTTSITENLELGETVLQVLAEDVDTHNVSYWLTGTAEGRLSIDNTGLITVSGNIDREEFQGGNFSFLVVADGGTLATAEVIIVVNDVNDCVPRFPSIDTMVVMENVSPGEGLEVGSVTAYDLDAGSNGELSYTLESGENNGFRINETTGLITAHMMYNRETAPFFTLLVAATDMGQNVQFSTVTTVQVKIGDENDNAPYFPYAYMYTRIFENSPIGKEVFLLQAVDLDEGENAELTYSLLSPQSDSGQVFELNQTTGAIRLAQSLDYEDPLQRHFSLTFSVADSMNEADTHTTLHIEVLDRNDNIPVIEITATPESLPLPENTAVGSVILELRASDEDSGVNAQLVFAVTDGDPNGDFVIISSGNDAVVSIANELDYERTTSYDLLFTVCDQGTPVGCSTLEHSITIDNIDDVVPAFNQSIYRASVEENQPPSSILQVAATDLDSRESFEYKIISGNDHDRFSINSTSGEISSTVMLDREEQETYTLVISAADEGGTPLSGTGTAIITVTDVNDNSPVGNSEWEVVMLLLDGTLPDNHSVTYFFNDPDTSSTFSNCSIIESVAINSFFDINRDECLLLLNSGNTPVNDYSVRVFEKNARIYSTVNIEVEHITLSDIPIDHLITVSLAVSSRKHLESVYTMFPDILSTLLGIDKNLVTVISIQNGYHNPTETVDVSFLVKTDENTYFSSPFVLQTLYRERDRFRSLSEYNLSALPTDPCSAEPCSSQASCTSIKTVHESSVTAISPSFVLVFPVIELGYECECVPGISGENCSINFNDCYSNPCHFDAQCIDEVNDYRCVCPPGTTGQDCSVSPDGCSSNPCQNGAECRDIPGSHSCLCLPGYHGPECQYQYFRTATTCDSSPCQNGGTCSPGRDSFTCICPDTHSGQLCETDTSPDGCTGNPCYNGSTCNDSDSELVCLCSVGFTGPFCRWPIDECELEPCLNGGTCATGLYGSYQCYCPPPYTGESCEVFVSGCESSPCENGGRCADVRDSSDYTCECVRGFYGDNCEYRVDPGDLCADDINPCIAGNCTYGLNSYTCTCLSDYSGEHCEVESPPATSCDANPCLHGGECILLSDSNDYNCSCTPGFAGTNCELNIDECSPNPCINGVCRDGINGYVCECDTLQVTGYNCDVWCPSGLSGDFCQTEISLCDPTLCQNGGTCAENRENGSYYCMCPPTHRGQACELDNTCDSVTCFNDGTCSALEDGGYGCVCSNGFEGDNCQLITVSFTGSSSQPTYRAYPSLHISPRGRVQLEFTTIDSDGLLLYNTQLQSGVSDDFIAVEVVGGQLVVSVSHGEGWVRLESSVLVSDGRWHQVTIDIAEKVYAYIELSMIVNSTTVALVVHVCKCGMHMFEKGKV